MPEPGLDDLQWTDGEADGAFGMTNFRSGATGLPFVVFVSQQGGARHGPRIEISPLPRYNPPDAVTVTLEQPPRPLGPISGPDLARVRAWIELNRLTLEAYWDGRIEYTEDMLAQIQPV